MAQTFFRRAACGATRSVQRPTAQLRVAEEIPIRTQTRAFALEEANLALPSLKAGTISGAVVTIGRPR